MAEKLSAKEIGSLLILPRMPDVAAIDRLTKSLYYGQLSWNFAVFTLISAFQSWIARSLANASEISVECAQQPRGPLFVYIVYYVDDR